MFTLKTQSRLLYFTFKMKLKRLSQQIKVNKEHNVNDRLNLSHLILNSTKCTLRINHLNYKKQTAVPNGNIAIYSTQLGTDYAV